MFSFHLLSMDNRWACGHIPRCHVRNANIRDRLNVDNIPERCRKARLRWFGHVKSKRLHQEYVGRNTPEMVPPGQRRRGRPNHIWMDCVNRYVRAIGRTKDDVHDRTGWKRNVTTIKRELEEEL